MRKPTASGWPLAWQRILLLALGLVDVWGAYATWPSHGALAGFYAAAALVLFGLATITHR